MKKENRFINLDKNNPKQAPMLKKKLSDSIKGRMNRYKRQAESHKTATAVASGPRVAILYGSETGNAEAHPGSWAQTSSGGSTRPPCRA